MKYTIEEIKHAAQVLLEVCDEYAGDYCRIC